MSEAVPLPPSPWRNVDPRDVPIVHRDELLPAVPEPRLHPDWLRERIASQPPWSPETTGDRSWLGQRALRPAAVLVPIVAHDKGATVLLTQRPTHMREHAGQIAFPGGRCDDDDQGVVDTALREAWEEIGLARERVEVVGQLPAYLTGTGYQVTPVVGLVSPGFELRLHVGEVAEAFEVPMRFLMDPRHHERRRLLGPEVDREFLAMPYSDGTREFFIWGATAGMLRNLYRLLIA